MGMAKEGEGDDPRRSGGSYKSEWENNDALSGHSLLHKSAEGKIEGLYEEQGENQVLISRSGGKGREECGSSCECGFL